MVNDSNYTTLFEGWGIGERGFGGGTTNHAWSGGGQTVIAKHLCGIEPLEAGYGTFLIEPCPASFTSASITVPTVKGKIHSSFTNIMERFTLKVTVPQNTTAIVRLPKGETIKVNGKEPSAGQQKLGEKWSKAGKIALALKPGEYVIIRNKRI